jgi:hypothetical protein
MEISLCLALVQGALVQRQQIVVPLTIRVSADIRGFARLTDHADISALPVSRVQNEERIGLGLNAFDHFFPRPHPTPGITEVCDVFMGALRKRFRDAGYLCVSHGNFLSLLASAGSVI